MTLPYHTTPPQFHIVSDFHEGGPRLELGVHVFGIMWNYLYFEIHCPLIYCFLLGNESGRGSRCTRY